MSSETDILPIGVAELTDRAAQMKRDGYRLVQICCTRLQTVVQISYSFDKDYRFRHLRVELADPATPVPSITPSYWGAYENEMHDLFALNITGMNVDYHGSFYKTSIPFPFSQPVCMPPAAKPAGGAK